MSESDEREAEPAAGSEGASGSKGAPASGSGPVAEGGGPHGDSEGPGGGSAGGSVRADSWIWSVRLTKTRSMAASACRAGHVRVNGERVKPAHPLRAGDEVRLRHAGRERVVIVQQLLRKRVGAPVAVQAYVDNSPPPPEPQQAAPGERRDRGAGRPTKRERRQLDQLRGRQ